MDPPSAPPTQPQTRGQVDGGAAPASSLSLTQRLLAWVREFIQFGMVGATAYVVDAGLFNLFQHGPLGFLAGHPNTAQFIAAATATLYSWIANRLWTYRGRTRDNATREAILFFFANFLNSYSSTNSNLILSNSIAVNDFCITNLSL